MKILIKCKHESKTGLVIFLLLFGDFPGFIGTFSEVESIGICFFLFVLGVFNDKILHRLSISRSSHCRGCNRLCLSSTMSHGDSDIPLAGTAGFIQDC